MLHNIANKFGLLQDTTGFDQYPPEEEDEEEEEEEEDEELQGFTELQKTARGKAFRLRFAETAFG